MSKLESKLALQILDGSSRFQVRDKVKHVLGVRMSRLGSSIMAERDHSLLQSRLAQMLRNRADVEDVMQEAHLKILEAGGVQGIRYPRRVHDADRI